MSGVSKGGAASRARGSGAPPRAASGFSVGGPGGAEAPGAAAKADGTCAAAPAAAAALSLLAAQEGGGGRGARRDAAARRRAAFILDELNGLQAELLGGRADPARLARLAALEEGEEGTDSHLRDTIRAIALRARIELARRTMDPRTSGTAAVR